MEIETTNLETPVKKHKVVLCAYFTGGQKLRLRELKDDTQREKLLVSMAIVSIDGNKEWKYPDLESMHGKDFDCIMLAIYNVMKESSMPTDEQDPEKKST